MREMDSDWYSPTRLLSTPTAEYDFPGDRFIPNRSLMDLDQARSLLTNRTKQVSTPKFNEEYRRKLEENLTLDSEGRPFRMLVFRGSPKSSRKSVRAIDEMRRDEAAEAFNVSINKYPIRRLPKGEARILDAPKLKDDYYMNIMDWGTNNILAVALGSELYLWNSLNSNTQKLLQVHGNDYPTSVAWSANARMLAVGHMYSKLQLWDAETSKLIRCLEGHTKRVGTVDWNEHILTSGSQDKSIINHDVRVRNSSTFRIQAHTQEVCRLKWSSGGVLASGGNDNMIYTWTASMLSSSSFLNRFGDHIAAVKALAWCPYQTNILASGGGTTDGCIKLWNTQQGMCINTINTKAQICGLEWNKHHKEILSGHGFSSGGNQNQLCLWRYPPMCKLGDLMRHSSRILHLSQSPDGVTVVSAGADETLRFWDVFGPPQAHKPCVSNLDSLLSLKTSPLR